MITPILELRIHVLDGICRAQRLPESAERTTVLDHLRFAARTLLPLVQQEEDDAMLDHLRDRDTIPAPAPSDEPPTMTMTDSEGHPVSDFPEGSTVTVMRTAPALVLPPPLELSDVASHWSLSHE